MSRLQAIGSINSLENQHSPSRNSKMSERQFSEHLQPSSDVIAAIAQMTITFQFSTHININLIAIRLIYAINRHDASVTYRNDSKCFL
jgi:uncharacterized membrane protein YdbT with pleckstrin-like domain